MRTYGDSGNDSGMTGCYVYLVPVEGLCEGDCAGTEEWHSAEGVLVAMDEKGAGRISPPLCSECLLSRLERARLGRA